MSTGQQNLSHLNQSDSNRFAYSFLPGLLFIALIWLIHALAYLTGADLAWLGIMPRSFLGLVGVFLSPLIHADLKHLLSNTFPLLMLSGLILFLHQWRGVRVLVLVYILSGLLTWFIGRHAYHIGASGVVYGMAGFLLFRGVFDRDRGSLAIAFAVLFLYSGLFYGLFPEEERVSWEGHLAGLVAGLVAALIYGKTAKPASDGVDKTLVQASVTQRHMSSTFIPYYLHYTVNYTVQQDKHSPGEINYTITQDSFPGSAPTKSGYTASLNSKKTPPQPYDSRRAK
ncbi:rhomboid family intramembrane serine protease [Pontibacter burrus]|uniref:Rhomboid family intramembrane serine protease n=1 Tax=Pontibacter burrus TaxID=2704466 RepID=A0A6B3LQX5_9BACT|nr:rhomboid family intramembrane serine protease [Pontibacter burrus]NEM99219.1 rhomboid family intramembrane serine protease [Pontibacter burrus]